MPLPSGIPRVTVTGNYSIPASGASELTGTVTFTPVPDRIPSEAYGVILLGSETATLDAGGAFSAQLVATDAADEAFVWRVDENITGLPPTSYNITLPASATPVDLASVATTDTLPTSYTVITGPRGPQGAPGSSTGALLAANNLNDVQSASASRTSLGLGNSATRAVGTTAGTVADGGDSRFTDARTPTAHAATHAAAGTDPVTPAAIGAYTAAAGTDLANRTTNVEIVTTTLNTYVTDALNRVQGLENTALTKADNLASVASTTTARLNLASGTGIVPVAPPTGVAATDQAAINAALAALPAGGGVAQLQAGIYVLPAPGVAASGCVSMSVNGSVLAGAGLGVTTLKVADGTSANITGVVRTPSGVANSRITVRDLTIDGNKANVSGSPVIIGFYCGVSPNGTATDTDITLERVEIKNCTDYGADPHERTTRLRVVGCVFHDNGSDGITLDACYDSTLEGCTSYSNTRHGFNFVTASTRVRVVNCEAYGNGSNGFTLQNGAKYLTFSACHSYNNTAAGWVINGVAQSGQQDNTAGGLHAFTGCTASTNGTHGFQFVGLPNSRLIGCHSQDASQAADNTSSHYRIAESGTDYSTNNSLIGCTWGQTSGVSNRAKYGIDEQSSSDGPTYVLGCSGSGTATGSLNLLNATSLLTTAHNGSSNGHPIGVYSPDLPSLHGWKEWNYPPDMVGSGNGQIMTGGTIYGMRVDAQSGQQISTINVSIAASGSGLTSNQCIASVINGETGAELARTGDLSSVLTGTGITPLPLTSSFTPAVGTKLAVLLLANGTTLPTLIRSSSTGVATPNGNLSAASPRRYFTAGTSQTSMPSGVTMSGTVTSGAFTYWLSLS